MSVPASAAVGGFDATQRVLYHQGLEHLYHTHQRIGSFTIRQVVNSVVASRGRAPRRIPDRRNRGKRRRGGSGSRHRGFILSHCRPCNCFPESERV